MALNTNSENLRTILEAVNGLPDAITVDGALSATSTNPVQNKVIKEALDGKAESEHTHAAEDIIGGTLAGKVRASATAMAAITDPQVRDIVCTVTDPGADTAVDYPNGTVIFVYE